METSDFENFLERYFNDQAEPHEKARFRTWLALVDKDLLLTKEQEKELFDAITARATGDEAIIRFHEKIKRTSRRTSFPFVIAAISIILIVVIALVWRTSSGSQHEMKAAVTGEKFILEDGSIIWLTAGSVIRLSEDFSSASRKVALEGEGLFEIAKDSLHPFTVTCGANTVIVIGTSFTLKQEAGATELIVLTGKVHLSTQASDVIDVLPGDQVIVTRRGKVLQQKTGDQHAMPLILTSSYDMKFRNTSMSIVLPRIGEMFNVDIHVSDSTILDCRITGDFTDLKLTDALDLITDILDVRCTISNDVVEISGQGCRM